MEIKDRKKVTIGNSFENSWKALLATVQALYKLMPVLMVVFVLMTTYLAKILALNTAWMMTALSLVIILSSVCIYTK